MNKQLLANTKLWKIGLYASCLITQSDTAQPFKANAGFLKFLKTFPIWTAEWAYYTKKEYLTQ